MGHGGCLGERTVGVGPLHVIMRHPMYVISAYWERITVMAVSAAGTIALVVLWLMGGERRRAALLLGAVPAYYVAIHAPTDAVARYLAPMIPFQMIALAAVLFYLFEFIVRRSRVAA